MTDAVTAVLKILQTETTCVGVSFFDKVAGLRPGTLFKKRLQHRRFPVNCAKLLREAFL